MSKLKEYLFFKQLSVTEFAKKLGISRGHLNQIVLKNTKPSRLLAKEIERATSGEVTAEELLKEKE